MLGVQQINFRTESPAGKRMESRKDGEDKEKEKCSEGIKREKRLNMHSALSKG